MLIRISNKDKIKEKWDKVWSIIEDVIPPIIGKGRMRAEKILQSVLNDQIYLWAVHADGNYEDSFGFILTSITFDVFSDSYSMFILGAAITVEGNSKEWVDAATEIYTHAIRKQCVRVFGYTKDETVLGLLRELKANTDYSYVYVDIGG